MQHFRLDSIDSGYTVVWCILTRVLNQTDELEEVNIRLTYGSKTNISV